MSKEQEATQRIVRIAIAIIVLLIAWMCIGIFRELANAPVKSEPVSITIENIQ